MSLPRIIRNFNAFVDGRSYFGVATEAKLPQPKIMTEAHRGAGMDMPVGIDMGMEAMSAELTIAEYDVNAMKMLGRINRLVLRPAAQDPEGTDANVIIASIGGLFTANEFGDLKSGSPSTLKIMVDVRTYRLEVDGVVIHDINGPEGKRVIGGVDQLRGIRRAMGL